MFRLPAFPALAVCAAAIASASTAAAQTKVGVINLQKALLDTAELKKAAAELPLKYKARQDELEKLQREMQDIQTQLQTSAGKLSAAGQADLEARGQDLQRKATRLNQDLQDDVNNDRNEILQRAGTRMREVVKKIAEEKALDIVLVDDGTNPFYVKPAVDITAEATAAYDKAYPTK
ncbi:MAG TPA: OmpH family outer membrane protein [Bryobacteraceae bacterium]|nr:OmpH family outer membrane protein [Bryobacteraceae bacterium]